MEEYTDLKEVIYNVVLQETISGKYQPGDTLNGKRLIGKYEINKSSAQDVLIALCTDGVIRNIPRYGYEIIHPTHVDIYKTLQYQRSLESGVLRENYKHFDGAEIELPKLLNRNCRQDDADPIQYWRFDTDFHGKLIELRDNTLITINVKCCVSRLLRAYSQLYWGRHADRLLSYDTKHHELIIADLARKDPEVLVRDIRDNLRNFGGYTGL